MQIDYTYFIFLSSFVFIDTQTHIRATNVIFYEGVFDDLYTKLDHQVWYEVEQAFEAQTGRLRVRFRIVSLEFFTDIILPSELRAWSRLSF
jgi:hypothetical protein